MADTPQGDPLSHTLNSLTMGVGETCDLLLPNRIWQRCRVSLCDGVLLYIKGEGILQV